MERLRIVFRSVIVGVFSPKTLLKEIGELEEE